MSLVNSARRAGDFRVLYPQGVNRVDEVPWPLQEAINHGLMILAWYENYLSEEIPPENLWDDAEAIEEHFTRVRDRRGLGQSQGGGDVEAEMADNELASVFKGR